MRHITFVLSLLGAVCAGACSKAPAPPASSPSAPAESAPPTGTTTAAPPTIAPVDAGASPPVADAQAATPEPGGDAVEAPDTAAARAPTPDAGAAAAAEPGAPFVAPPGTPVVQGVEPEVVARLMAAEPGCVGLAKSGRAMLSVDEDERGKIVLIQPTSGDAASWPLAGGAAELLATGELPAALSAGGFVPCRTAAPAGGALVVPKAVPVTVRETQDRWVEAVIDGNRPVVVRRMAASDLGSKLVAVYWSEGAGALWVRLRDVDDEEQSYLEVVSPAALGEPACVPRPVGGKAPDAAAPPPFDPKPPKLACVAMTPDGRKAAFKTFFVSKRDDVRSLPNAIAWFGPGDTPDIDLSCMLRGCKGADLERIVADAARLGLVGCAQARNKVVVDGQVVPLLTGGEAVAREESVLLKTGGGWRPIHKLRIGLDGEGHEEVWRVVQLPSGGPIYLYVGNSDMDLEEVTIAVLDDAAMNLCPARAADALAVREVKASAAQRDGRGYRFAAGNLVDGDLTSAWQARTWRPGEEAPWIELVLDGEREVTAVELANGWQRRDGNGDLFALNARAAEATLTFGDGSTETVALPDARGLSRVQLQAPKRTDRVRISFSALHEGSAWPRDLAVAEVQLIGR